MDFSNRSAPAQPGATAAHTAAPAPSKKSKHDGNKWARISSIVLVAAVAVLLLALVALVSFGSNSKEDKYVDSSKLQAVFLNTGQVYFGNIKTLNNKYFVVTNIYYLQTANSGSSGSAANANTSVSLVKLGCELHEPFDKMIINRDQVTFWENLQDGGQVATAVKTFEKQNPSGQKCADQSSSSSSTTNKVQSANNNSSSGSGSSSSNP